MKRKTYSYIFLHLSVDINVLLLRFSITCKIYSKIFCIQEKDWFGVKLCTKTRWFHKNQKNYYRVYIFIKKKNKTKKTSYNCISFHFVYIWVLKYSVVIKQRKKAFLSPLYKISFSRQDTLLWNLTFKAYIIYPTMLFIYNLLMNKKKDAIWPVGNFWIPSLRSKWSPSLSSEEKQTNKQTKTSLHLTNETIRINKIVTLRV